MSNFSNIGFSVASHEDMERMIDAAMPKAKEVQCSAGSYYHYQEDNGASLWMQVVDNSIVGCNPHFAGNTKRRIVVTDILPDPDYIMDGALYAWANPSDEADAESGDYPFVFHVPDYSAVKPDELPKFLDIQLTAFAGEFEAFANEDEYHANQDEDGMQLAAEAFIPSGLFIDPDAPEGTQPQAYGLFSGTVTAARAIEGQLMGGKFYALEVNTLGGPLDVVLSDNLHGALPQTGSIVRVSGWLSGRIVGADKPAAKKRNWFGRGN